MAVRLRMPAGIRVMVSRAVPIRTRKKARSAVAVAASREAVSRKVGIRQPTSRVLRMARSPLRGSVSSRDKGLPKQSLLPAVRKGAVETGLRSHGSKRARAVAKRNNINEKGASGRPFFMT